MQDPTSIAIIYFMALNKYWISKVKKPFLYFISKATLKWLFWEVCCNGIFTEGELLLPRDGINIPVKKMQIFLSSSHGLGNIFIFFWGKSFEFPAPSAQASLADGNEKKLVWTRPTLKSVVQQDSPVQTENHNSAVLSAILPQHLQGIISKGQGRKQSQ